MRLLDRYLLRELLIPFGYGLAGFLVFWVAFDLFDELTDFQKESLRWADVLEYYLIKTPEFLVVVVPVALLLALLYALSNHARHQELTAIRAAGVSLMRLALPYFVVGAVLSVALFALNELWVPRTVDEVEQIRKRRLTNQVEIVRREWAQKVGFELPAGGTCFIGSYNLETAEMREVHLVVPERDGGWRKIEARGGGYTNDGWVLSEVEIDLYPPGQGVPPLQFITNQLVVPELPQTPEEIRSHVRVSRLLANPTDVAKRAQLSIQEIRISQQYYRRDRTRLAMLATQLHGRIAAAFTCLMVVLIAIPFGAAPGRRNVFVGVAASVFICFAYFILMRVGLALGTGGYLKPWLAAWSPHLVFAALAVTLTVRVR